MTKAPKPTEMSKGQSENTNNATKGVKYVFLRKKATVTKTTTMMPTPGL